MTNKARLIATITLSAALGVASLGSPTAGADPNYYSTLSCKSCKSYPGSSLAIRDQIYAGIEAGLAQLQGKAS